MTTTSLWSCGDPLLLAGWLFFHGFERDDLFFLFGYLLLQFIRDLSEDLYGLLSLRLRARAPRLLVRALMSELEFDTGQ